jgi:hypothetical protein
MRFADGPYMGMASPVNIFDFPDDDDPSVVYLETDSALTEVTRADEVSLHKETFAQIREVALAPAATRKHLEELADTQE